DLQDLQAIVGREHLLASLEPIRFGPPTRRVKRRVHVCLPGARGPGASLSLAVERVGFTGNSRPFDGIMSRFRTLPAPPRSHVLPSSLASSDCGRMSKVQSPKGNFSSQAVRTPLWIRPLPTARPKG